MILYPPIKFDANEWFIIVSMGIVLIPVFLLSKRFSALTVVFLMLFNVFLGQTVDYIIAVPPYDLYDMNDIPNYEIFDFLVYFVLYPPSAYLVVYFFDKWKLRGWNAMVYIIGCAAVTMGLEWLAHMFHVFTYKGWKLMYSFPIYIAVYGLNVLMLNWIQNFIKKHSLKIT